MVSLDSVTKPITTEVLIGFADLRGFLRASKSLKTSLEMFVLMDGIARVMTEVVSHSSGRIIKYLGDAALIAYPGEEADAGMKNLLEVKDAVDVHLKSKQFNSTLVVNAHYGEATIGEFGPQRWIDVLGDTVARAAVVGRGEQRSEFVISPEAFRRLESETRKVFRKHTPPIVYVTK